MIRIWPLWHHGNSWQELWELCNLSRPKPHWHAIAMVVKALSLSARSHSQDPYPQRWSFVPTLAQCQKCLNQTVVCQWKWSSKTLTQGRPHNFWPPDHQDLPSLQHNSKIYHSVIHQNRHHFPWMLQVFNIFQQVGFPLFPTFWQ